MSVFIRPEEKRDHQQVFAINQSAFPEDAEARLVDHLRRDAQPAVSLVAELDGQLLGHIFFSPVSITGSRASGIAGLAPMAVVPEHQGKGIGSALVHAGLAACRDAGYSAVVVLGHPEYYPRFGFTPASRFSLVCEFSVPDETFMAVELDHDALRDLQGTVHYHPLFHIVES